MKRFICCLIVIILILTGCSASGYQLINENGNYYILYEGQPEPTNPNDIVDGPAPVVRFSSISEMRDDILAGRFSQEELAQISKFRRDDQGRILLCNMSTLFAPSFPSIFEEYRVGWQGNSYYLFFNSKNFNHSTFLNFLGKAQYEEELSTIENLEANPYVKVISKTTDNSSGVVTLECLSSDELHAKLIIYTVSSGDRILHVEETYYLDESAVIPKIIEILGNEYGQYYQIYLSDLNIPPLTEEQILEFGIHEYS